MNFRSLDLNLMRVFAAVMVERNVTRAAAQLAMTQPAVSNALRRLREATGQELFVTVPSGVSPTVQAEALWPEVRAALEGLRQAFDPQGFDPARDERTFAMAMADATATVLIPAFVDALAHVGARAAEGPRSVIVLEPLYVCEYVCVMRRDHALARQATLPLDAYCAARHVRVNFTGRPRGFVDEALARQGRERRVVLTVNQFATAARVVHDSDLLTVLPRSFVPASGLAEGLVLRRFPGTLPHIDVGMLWHRRNERDAAHRWLRETFAEATRGLGIGEPALASVPATSTASSPTTDVTEDVH